MRTMLYSAATFAYHFAEDWQKDLFEQALADIGFDSFDGEVAYIPTKKLDEAALRNTVAAYEGVTLSSINACEDQNWNEAWEADHPVMELPSGIRIMPHCAFGAGYHETTGMMMDRLRLWEVGPLRCETAGAVGNVLDNGCGTGVLGIMAARYGATHVTMVDIDEKSVKNARENIELNRAHCADTQFTVLHGDTPPNGKYDLILSNIHRNVLLAQMPLYAAYLAPKGEIWLSGFYEEDCPTLIAAAEKEGLKLKDKVERGDWRMLVLEAENG